MQSYLTSPYTPPATSDVVIDLYHGNPVNVDFTTIRQFGILGVILKATQGSGFIDPMFKMRRGDALMDGLLVGAYHFLDGSDPVKQTDNLLRTIGNSIDSLLIAVDFESYPLSQPSVSGAVWMVERITRIISRRPMLYANRFMFSHADPMLSLCDLWLAEYGTRPIPPPGWDKWKLWQYTDGVVGKNPVSVPGIGPCDRSKFAGTPVELGLWWGK